MSIKTEHSYLCKGNIYGCAVILDCIQFYRCIQAPSCGLNLCFILCYWCFVSIDTVDSITPDKVRGLRDLLNSSAMDIMYYNSPLYRDEVRVAHFQKVCFL